MADDPARLLADTGLAADLHAWRQAHPEATLTEIEQALDARLHEARAGLLAEVAADAPAAAACCSDCGGRLVRRGARTRTLRTAGDAAIPLRRPYLTCPVCRTGVSPPR